MYLKLSEDYPKYSKILKQETPHGNQHNTTTPCNAEWYANKRPFHSTIVAVANDLSAAFQRRRGCRRRGRDRGPQRRSRQDQQIQSTTPERDCTRG
jgi:hypothetical protein